MKKYPWIVVELLVLIIASIWWYQEHGWEPLTLIIPSVGALIATLFFRTANSAVFSIKYLRNGTSKKPLEISSQTPRDEEGRYLLLMDEKIGKREITWRFTIEITNNSSNNAYEPELYIRSDMNSLVFTSVDDFGRPIAALESRRVDSRFVKYVFGSQIEREKESSVDIPPEIKSKLNIILIYKDEDQKFHMTRFDMQNGSGRYYNITNIPDNFVKVKIYKSL